MFKGAGRPLRDRGTYVALSLKAPIVNETEMFGAARKNDRIIKTDT